MYKLLLFFCLFIVDYVASEKYYESLDVVHLANDDLAAKLSFTSLKDISFGHWTSHYDLFPKLIIDLIRKYDVEEFHLSLTQGFWRNRQWGTPLSQGPTGAQIWAWFSQDVKNVDQSWRNFIHALSGLFCASFSQIDGRMTVSPSYSFRPEGIVDMNETDNKFVRFGVLPSENVCTENLTPWKKLLPCKSGGGIGRVLNPLKVFAASYNSLSIDLRRICADEQCRRYSLQLTQTSVIVFDNAANRNWNLRMLFGSVIDKPCVVAESSLISIKIPAKYNPRVTDVEVFNQSTIDDERNVLISFDVLQALQNKNYIDSIVQYSVGSPKEADSSQPAANVTVHTYSSGTGQYKGIIVSRIENGSARKKKVMYSHMIPWFLRVYYHTLKVQCNGDAVKPDFVVYEPARDRQRPHYFEIIFSLPSTSVCFIKFEYQRQLLKWTEYPPDASHGFSIPGPCLSFYQKHDVNTLSDQRLANDKLKYLVRIFGENVLISLPTPDFSMPYNVICLVCTAVVLAFGPIHNLTTRLYTIKTKEEINEKSPMTKLRKKLKRVFSKFPGKKEHATVEGEVHPKKE